MKHKRTRRCRSKARSVRNGVAPRGQRQKRRGPLASAAALKSHCRLAVVEIGKAVRIDYGRGKQTYTHPFRGAMLYASHDGKALVIAPVEVIRGQIHG